MELVTVVNRTNKPLEVLWDGKVRAIPVGKSLHAVEVAKKAKEQNILMGSQDPRDPRSVVYLVGIEEWKDDCSLLADSRPRGIERWDRSLMPGGHAAVQYVPGRTGYMSGADIKANIGENASFESNPESNPIPKLDRL